MKSSKTKSKPTTGRPMKDLKANQDPKGGSFQHYVELNGQSQGSIKGSSTQQGPSSSGGSPPVTGLPIITPGKY